MKPCAREDDMRRDAGRRTNGNDASMASPSSSPRLDIPMAPTLRPTALEFECPLSYIRSIRQQGYHKYGIVKIVPPQGWRPPFAINKETFRFNTRVQSINELQRRHIIAAKSQAFSKKVCFSFPGSQIDGD